MTVAALSTAVQARIGSDYLIQITNATSSATSINTTVLDSACADSIGDFERVSRIAHDTSNASHLAILVKGVIYFLETYKGRDSGFIDKRGKDFYSALSSLQKGTYVEMTTNSNLTVTREQSGTRSDMDKLRTVWPENQKGSGAKQYETIEP